MPEELFQKYRNGNCSPQEMDELFEYFIEYPSEIEQYFTEEEWQLFYTADKETNNDALTESQSGKLYHNTESLIRKNKKIKTIYLASGAVAACLLLFFGLKFYRQQVVLPHGGSEKIVKNTLLKKNNFSNAPVQVLLSDSSMVTLYSNSEIRYDSVFYNERNIYLTGKAKFDVVHNASKILKVWCKDVVTTDIGTVFVIDGLQDNVRVDLLEGKASVAKIKDEKNIVYLSAGQFASYNKTTDQLAIGTTPSTNQLVIKNSKTNKPVTIDAGLIQIQNRNLKKVFDQLSAKYNVSIEYPYEKINRSRINIAVDTTLSIEVILKNLALVSDLQLIKQASNKYILK